VVTARATTELRAHLAGAYERALGLTVAAAEAREGLTTTLVTETIPGVDVEVAALRSSDLDKRAVNAIVADWNRFHGLVAQGTLSTATPEQASAAAKQVSAIFDDATAHA
jgi:hypothetical protein